MSPSVPLQTVTGRPLELLRSHRVGPSDLYRALANQPELLEAWIEFAWALRGKAQVPRALRELLILRAAQLQNASYVWSDHVTMALEAGVDRAQIEALVSWKDSPQFDRPTRVAIQVAEEMVEGHVATATLEALEPEFDPGERVELILTVGFYTMIPRILDALRLPAGPGPESEEGD